MILESIQGEKNEINIKSKVLSCVSNIFKNQSEKPEILVMTEEA